MSLQAETEFFHDIAPKVRDLVLGFEGKAAVAKYKRVGDYATEIDVAVENMIVTELQKRFPDDEILAEEGHSETAIPDGRIWIIDPICGTTNLGRGLKTFCTNIALADNHELVAACVVDHSQDEYIWSVGSQKVYVNNQLFARQVRHDSFGVVIDVDLGALGGIADGKQELCNAIYKLLQEPGYILESLNSSLGFTYTAIDKFDGFINSDSKPWDICAGSFLIQQSGGIITDLKGDPWKISSHGAIAANGQAVHQTLLRAYKAVKL